MVKNVKRTKLKDIEDQIEAIFNQGKQECLKLIRQIHSEKLYLETHKSFEKYMNDRWGVSRRRGYQLISAAEALESVNHGTHSDQLGERQLRELAKVPEEQRAEVIESATEAAGGQAPTARQIADAAKSVIDPEDETEWKPVDDTEDQDEFEDEPDLEVVDQEKPSTASIVRDHLDREVPLHLRDAYSRGQELDSLGRQLDKIKSEAKRLAALPGSNHLPIQEVELNCKLLKDLIQQARYWTACPRCDGKGCSRCQESGFLSLNKKSSLSKADKQVLGV